MASIQKQCEDAIVTVIQDLNLTGITDSEIMARRSPWKEGTPPHPHGRGFVIHPVSPTKSIGTNVREDVGYGVGIFLAWPSDQSGTSNRDTVPLWLETVFDKIVEDRISITLTGGTFLTVTWEFGQLQIPKEFFAYETSQMVARCWVRRTRT